MRRQIVSCCWFAWKDWLNEYLVSTCAVLALASMLAPILILLGLKTGVATAMRDRLLSDPSTLIIVPKSDAGNFSSADIQKFGKLPGAAYAIGRIRETASDITVEHGGKRVSITLEPAAPKEPTLLKYGFESPLDGPLPQIILSQPAARALGIAPGQILTASLGRKTPDGVFESEPVKLKLIGILPLNAASRRMAFAPRQLLDDMENYRDYIAVENRHWTGKHQTEARKYASFRLYAENLDAVERLAKELASRHIETTTKAREIANIKALETAINQIIFIISIAIGAGFAAFILSSSESAIRKKMKMLALLRLFGMRRFALLFYPLAQTFLTAIAGFIFSLLIYLAVANAIAWSFQDKGGLQCHLSAGDLAGALLLILLLSFAASIRAAHQAANMEPSMVIREI